MYLKAHCLHTHAISGEIWGDATTLSKFHHKLQKQWSDMHYFQLLSANAFIIVFNSSSVRDEVLKSLVVLSYHQDLILWRGRFW